MLQTQPTYLGFLTTFRSFLTHWSTRISNHFETQSTDKSHKCKSISLRLRRYTQNLNMFVVNMLALSLSFNVISASPTLPRNSASANDLCSNDNPTVQLGSGSSEYLMRVPTDGEVHQVIGGKQEIGCLNIAGPFHQQCLPCNVPINKIGVSVEAGTCEFDITGLEKELVVSHKDGAVAVKSPGQIISIRCETAVFERDTTNPEHRAASHRDTTSSTKRKGVNKSDSADASCPTGEQWNTVIVAESGTYHIAMPLDLMAHWSWELSCFRASDNACVPCNQIGSAVGVMTRAQFGPCIFFTEDHRSFTVPTYDSLDGSGLTPFVPVDPGNAISGTECGTA